MPDHQAICLYEVGVRLSQCLRAHPAHTEDDYGFPAAYRLTLLHRLEESLLRLVDVAGQNSVVARASTRLTDQLFTDAHNHDSAAQPLHTLLANLQASIYRWVDGRQPTEPSRDWFRLGLAIADAEGEEPSERLDYDDRGVLTSNRSAAAQWHVRDPNLVNELLSRLEMWGDFPGMVQLRPDYDDLPDFSEVLPGTPPAYWGWVAIELGLRDIQDSVNESSPARRRRGRPRDPRVRERDQWIRQFVDDHPGLSGRDLREALEQKNEERGLGYTLSPDIIRGATRRS